MIHSTHEEVVLGVLEDHVDGFVLKYDLFQGDYVFVINLSVQLSFRQACVQITEIVRTAISRIAL